MNVCDYTYEYDDALHETLLFLPQEFKVCTTYVDMI